MALYYFPIRRRAGHESPSPASEHYRYFFLWTAVKRIAIFKIEFIKISSSATIQSVMELGEPKQRDNVSSRSNQGVVPRVNCKSILLDNILLTTIGYSVWAY